MDDFLLPLPEVMRRVGLGRTTIYDRVAAGTFPAPRKLGEHPSAPIRWRSSEIDAWIEGLPVARLRRPSVRDQGAR
jgi:prophage regulatory protein